VSANKELWPEVDVIVFTVADDQLKVLLVKRPGSSAAFPNAWALPGGSMRKHIEVAATLEAVAMRELAAKTGAEAPYLEQLGTFGGQTRDPRSWTISVAYFALIPYDKVQLKPEARWWPVHGEAVGTQLAFDHGEILAAAITRLRSKLEYSAIAGHLLGEEFTLPHLQKVYEIILGERLNKQSFRRNVARAGVLEATGRLEESRGHRRAELYRFTKDARSVLFFPRSIVYAASAQAKGEEEAEGLL